LINSSLFNRNGFTLLEVLIVLGIISFIILLSIPISFKIIETHQEKNFIEMFEFDLLYIQSLAITTTKENVRIVIDKDQYKIVKGERDSLISIRTIPENIHINTRLRPIISFDENGRIRDPNKGRIEIETKQSKYIVIFPLGKGRCSIVKQ